MTIKAQRLGREGGELGPAVSVHVRYAQEEDRQRGNNRMLINFQQINAICVSSEILQREQFFTHEV